MRPILPTAQSTDHGRRRAAAAPVSAAVAAPGGAALFDAEAWAASTAKPGDYFDDYWASHAEQFFPRCLRHTKDRWAGHPFWLLPWQRSIVRAAFGWHRADGTRRFRIVWVEVPRKNGKTALGAGVGLYLAFLDATQGAEVYCAASTKQQASIVFNEAKRMRAQSPYLREHTNAFKFNISSNERFSKMEVIASDYGSLDGLNVSGVIGDEVHAWRDRGLYDVLHTGEGARLEPMEFLITTAGVDLGSIGGEFHEHAEAVRDGRVEDHGFLPVIYAAGKDDDWRDPKTWEKANPSLGATLRLEALEAEANRAALLPRHLNAFKRFYLNVWTEQETLWLDVEKWRACSRGADTVTLDALAGRACYGGLDLSSTTDLTALALMFPRPAAAGAEGEPSQAAGWDLWVHFWLPKDGLDDRIKRDRVPYDQWQAAGFLTLTEGDTVDYDVIRRMITGEAPGADPERLAAWRREAIINRVNLISLARDRWNAAQLTTQLMSDGVKVVDFGQGYASMSAPSKEFERLATEGLLNHGGNPVMDWMARVVSVKQDGADNIKPVKPDRRRTGKRIDGIVAAVMGLGIGIAEDRPFDINELIMSRGGLG